MKTVTYWHKNLICRERTHKHIEAKWNKQWSFLALLEHREQPIGNSSMFYNKTNCLVSYTNLVCSKILYRRNDILLCWKNLTLYYCNHKECQTFSSIWIITIIIIILTVIHRTVFLFPPCKLAVIFHRFWPEIPFTSMDEWKQNSFLYNRG